MAFDICSAFESFWPFADPDLHSSIDGSEAVMAFERC